MMTEGTSSSSDSLLMRLIQCNLSSEKSTNREPSNKKDLRQYENFSDDVVRIGEGGFSRVYRCRGNAEQYVVLKEINITESSTTVPSEVIREVSLLRELDHPNIVRLRHAQSKSTVNRNVLVNLVFESLDCDLQDFISRGYGSTNLLTIKNFMHQMLSALAYCHAHKILHRDLKPKNVLVDVSKRIVKLADFGLARPFGERGTIYSINVGTRWYRAPEILLNSKQYTGQIDVWSLGCIFGEMVSRKCVFQSTGLGDELVAIFSVLGTPTEETWPGVTGLPNFLPTYRDRQYPPTDLAGVFPRLEPEGLNLLSRMLVLDPVRRISVETALNHPYFEDLKSKRSSLSRWWTGQM